VEFGGAPAKYQRNVQDGYFTERSTGYKKGVHVGVMEIRDWSFEDYQEAGISIVGDPDYVTEQIISQCDLLGIDKIMMRPVFGKMRLSEARGSIELMAREVIPNLKRHVPMAEAVTSASL